MYIIIMFWSQQSEEKQNTQKIEKEKKLIKELEKLFKQYYPNIPFENLQKQNDIYSTDDGCIHYKNIKNNEIYSFDYDEGIWMQHYTNYQQSLLDLFE